MTETEAAAVVAIQQLMARYNRTGDDARLDVDAIFAPGAVLELPVGSHTGLDAVRKFFEGRRTAALLDLANGRRARHHITTSLIEITDPVSATGETYFLLIRSGNIEQMGSYFDKFVKLENRWRIAHRKAVMYWRAPV